jgi:hypothetical protein
MYLDLSDLLCPAFPVLYWSDYSLILTTAVSQWQYGLGDFNLFLDILAAKRQRLPAGFPAIGRCLCFISLHV